MKINKSDITEKIDKAKEGIDNFNKNYRGSGNVSYNFIKHQLTLSNRTLRTELFISIAIGALVGYFFKNLTFIGFMASLVVAYLVLSYFLDGLWGQKKIKVFYRESYDRMIPFMKWMYIGRFGVMAVIFSGVMNSLGRTSTQILINPLTYFNKEGLIIGVTLALYYFYEMAWSDKFISPKLYDELFDFVEAEDIKAKAITGDDLLSEFEIHREVIYARKNYKGNEEEEIYRAYSLYIFANQTNFIPGYSESPMYLPEKIEPKEESDGLEDDVRRGKES